MVGITQIIMTQTIGHAVLLELQYHNVYMLIQYTVVLEVTMVVVYIVIGALPQQQLVLSVTLLLKVQTINYFNNQL